MKHLNTLHSMADEIFSEPSKPRTPGRWIWLFASILGLLFVYRSTRPVMRLRRDPPPSFYDYSTPWNQAERQNKRRLAEAYWQVAVRRIQVYYSADRPLPSAPPPQFRIGGLAGNLGADTAANRVHYWYRLREVWNQDDAWNVSYGWNINWVETETSSLPQYIPQWLSYVFQGIVTFFDSLAQRISAP
jgi:hypothetical protein